MGHHMGLPALGASEEGVGQVTQQSMGNGCEVGVIGVEVIDVIGIGCTC